MPSARAVTLAILVFFPGLLRAGPQEPTDSDVAKGIALVEAGEFDDAILLLEPAARRLAAERGRPKDLGRAYAYLAIAYLGLNHETTAKAKFLEAIHADRDLTLGADQFSPRIIALFEQARREALQQSGAPAGTPQRKGGSAKVPLIIGGVGVAVAGVAVAAGGGGSDEIPPEGRVTITLTLNGVNGGTHSCSTGLFFVVTASNTRQSSVQLNRLDLMFTTTSPGCVTHSDEQAGVNPTRLDIATLAPGASDVRLRQVDLAGDLCDPPRGTSGCFWQAVATLQTSVGTVTSQGLQFATSR
jgi:hypothetical protein